MARAVCPGCRRVVSWKAGSGCRQADVRCPDCGAGGLKRFRWQWADMLTVERSESGALRRFA